MKLLICAVVASLSAVPLVAPRPPMAPTSGETALVGLAGVYQTVADSILANKNSEKNLVLAILKVERDLVVEALDRAAASESGGAGAELQSAARRLGEFATEGGAIIEPIRNRLLQGGHHHHASDSGPEALFDSGYVVLTKALKREALALAKHCAMLAGGSEISADKIGAIRAEFLALAGRALQPK